MSRGGSTAQQDRLEALAVFVPKMESPGFQFGHWDSPSKRTDGVIEMPFFIRSLEAAALIQTCYDMGWVLVGFDWPRWAQTPEAVQLRNDSRTLERATVEQLGRLLTVLIRQDRFVEGTLHGAFESGLLIRILQRAAVLATASPEENE